MSLNMNEIFTTKKMVFLGIFSAIAFVLAFIEIPIGPFLKIDASDVPAVIATFTTGIFGGIIVELIKNLLAWATKSATYGIGELANFLVGISFIIPFGLFYAYSKTKSLKTITIAFVIATIVSTYMGAILNYYVFIPLYASVLHWPIDGTVAAAKGFIGIITDLKSVILFYITPFNIIKGILISVLSFGLYKALRPVINKFF